MKTRDHAADSAGDPQVLAAKRVLRDEVWTALEDAGAARFPGTRGRIPNFTGAEAAAERLRDTDAWPVAANVVPEGDRAGAIKANPDAPQWPVRQRALEDGVVVYMAVPRLAREQPFMRLDPAVLDVSPRRASSIKGASRHGHLVDVDDLDPVTLVVVGSVAVDPNGARLGKGGGFSDLEFALAFTAKLIDQRTVVATTVHSVQVVETGRIPMIAHDVPVDLVVTPEEVIVCDRWHVRPEAVLWDELSDSKLAAIPLLARLQPQ